MELFSQRRRRQKRGKSDQNKVKVTPEVVHMTVLAFVSIRFFLWGGCKCNLKLRRISRAENPLDRPEREVSMKIQKDSEGIFFLQNILAQSNL